MINSLRRLGLAKADDLRLTTLDLSPRVNLHLQAARRRAIRVIPYVVVLPRERNNRWRTSLLEFWKTFGSRIGEETSGTYTTSEGVDMRAIRIRPEVIPSIAVRCEHRAGAARAVGRR